MSRALFLIGSPKPGASASRTFAEAVEARLRAHGWESRTERVAPAFHDETRMREILGAIAESDLVVFAFPVYVDSLPAPALRLLEAWSEAIAEGPHAAQRCTRLAVLTQCGFPESSHCNVAVEVCRLFAEQTGVEWAGALAFGMGGSIEGGSIERSPLAGRVASLDVAVDALALGDTIPESSTADFARPLVPAWAYPLVGGFAWSSQARKRGCDTPLKYRRYAQPVR